MYVFPFLFPSKDRHQVTSEGGRVGDREREITGEREKERERAREREREREREKEREEREEEAVQYVTKLETEFLNN